MRVQIGQHRRLGVACAQQSRADQSLALDGAHNFHLWIAGEIVVELSLGVGCGKSIVHSSMLHDRIKQGAYACRRNHRPGSRVRWDAAAIDRAPSARCATAPTTLRCGNKLWRRWAAGPSGICWALCTWRQLFRIKITLINLKANHINLPCVPRIGQRPMHRNQIGRILIEGIVHPSVVDGLLHLGRHIRGQHDGASHLARCVGRIFRRRIQHILVCIYDGREWIKLKVYIPFTASKTHPRLKCGAVPRRTHKRCDAFYDIVSKLCITQVSTLYKMSSLCGCAFCTINVYIYTTLLTREHKMTRSTCMRRVFARSHCEVCSRRAQQVKVIMGAKRCVSAVYMQVVPIAMWVNLLLYIYRIGWCLCHICCQ